MRIRLTTACFFLTSVAFTAGWSAVSSLIGYYKALYGPHMLLHLNLAYFLPSLPVMLLQSLCDSTIDRRFGRATPAAVRLCIGLGGSAAISMTYPFYDNKRMVLLLLVALLGLCNSIAFSTAYQVVTHFQTESSVALTTGFVASGPVVVLAEAALGIGSEPTEAQQLKLFLLVTAITCAGWAAAMLLIYTWWQQLHNKRSIHPGGLLEDSSTPLRGAQHRSSLSLQRHHRSPVPENLQLSTDEAQSEAQLDVESSGSSDRGVLARTFKRRRPPSSPTLPLLDELERGQHAAFAVDSRTSSMSSRGSSVWSIQNMQQQLSVQLVKQSMWPAALALFLSVSTSILVFPFFPYIPSSGHFGRSLPQVLFGARVISDVVGRLLPRAQRLYSKAGLLILATIKAAMTPFFFVYISAATSYLNDVSAVCFVAIFWLLSGYVNNAAYVMAPQWRYNANTPAGSIMALVFQMSSLLALLLAFWLEHGHYSSI